MKAEPTQNPSQFSEKRNEQLATVRIIGNLAQTPGGKRQEIERVNTPVKIGELLEYLTKSFGLILRRESTLVLVNGVEANALEDLDTVVKGGDEVFLVPMIHGG